MIVYVVAGEREREREGEGGGREKQPFVKTIRQAQNHSTSTAHQSIDTVTRSKTL